MLHNKQRYRNVCNKLNDIVSNTTSKYVVTDTQEIDAELSNEYKNKNDVKLGRVSRFSKIFKVNKETDYICIPYIGEDIVYGLFIFKSDDDDYNEYCNINEITENNNVRNINNNNYALITTKNDIVVRGYNVYVAVVMFYKKKYPFPTMINSEMLPEMVFLSRYKKIYNEIPNENWFKFYIEYMNCFSTHITVILNGCVINIRPDYKTYCILSGNAVNNNTDIIDDCKCCYKDTSYVLAYNNSNNINNIISLNNIPGGLGIDVDGLGKFTASYIGTAPNHKYIKICFNVLISVLFNYNKIAGRGYNTLFVYGIAHK
ncbi:protein A51 [BeAn 58058 virus]|uniref:protein A51 n=1 Tax=BeAn 58058 virus TaxID=67082 RepID=UPI00090B2EED|nr:protein A51 [BeAn 58058 virus]APG58356.1 protein A51 [BeAn 58058 virus]